MKHETSKSITVSATTRYKIVYSQQSSVRSTFPPAGQRIDAMVMVYSGTNKKGGTSWHHLKTLLQIKKFTV